jgi:[FeFe] hydrogenase (group B1/B3)
MEVHGDRAVIDHRKCINCGRCQEVCPYHAIVFIPIPCMEACPVGAIYAEDDGKKNIGWDKCIFCGRCMRACPFGAIMERYEFIDVLQKIAAGKKVSALLAPAMAGQFNAEIERIGAACMAAGFTEAVEVARGADETAQREAAEFKERMARGDHLMTTSCCPAYLEAAKKHAPEILPFISATRTPMHYTARMAKDRDPEAVTVFIGPCVAKRAEAYADPLVDHVWTFEELAAVFEVKGIDVKTIAPLAFAEPGSPRGRGFPLTGGVAAAVQAARGDGVEIKIERIESLDHKSVRLLKSFAEKCPGNLVEVMACPEGCVAGPAVIENPKTAAARVNKLVRRGE